MEIYKYDPKAGYQLRKCEVCGRLRICCQHHIDGRKNTDRIIWVCSNKRDEILYTDPCHMKIHDPTAFKLPADWAYKNGYLVKLDSVYRPKKKSAKKWKLKKGIGLDMVK
jgi:hypothetical protein